MHGPAEASRGRRQRRDRPRAISERPELFDFTNINGGPEVVDPPAYMTAVVAALGEAGYCARIDPEGEIGVKKTNSFNEQWIIASRMGWGAPPTTG